jgi:hypothetical protein
MVAGLGIPREWLAAELTTTASPAQA